MSVDNFPNEYEIQSLTPLAVRHGVTLGAIAKNEAKYLPEWLAYHLAIGFDRIVVYSNDTEDNQNEILDEIAKQDYRVRWVTWPTRPGVSPQNSAYNDMLGRCTTPWVTFLDIDEFVVPLEDEGIHEWLATVPDEISTVHVNWRGFGSNGVLSPDYEFVTRTFEMAAPVEWGNHFHFKSFARTALAREATAHNIVTQSGRHTLSDFGDFEMTNFGISDRVVYKRIQVNHYQCKTFPEFKARMRNGNASFPFDNPNYARDDSWERFQKLDLNVELNQSIRCFDAALDESMNRIKSIITQS